MSDVSYVFTNPPQTDAVGGDPNTGDIWNEAFEAARLALYNTVASQIAGDMNLLRDLVGVTDSDSLTYRWGSVDTVIVEPGQAISGGETFTVENETTLSLDTDLDTGTRAADSIYFLWIGEDTVSGDTDLKISLSYDTPPASLVAASAYRLRHFFNTNSGDSNIEQFCDPLPDNWPVGLYLWDGPYKPAGCHWAHGQTVSRTHGAYANLFAKYGSSCAWGTGDGSTTFEVPDCRGRSPMGSGQGSGMTLRSLGETTGEEEHTLTIDEIPNHGQHGSTINEMTANSGTNLLYNGFNLGGDQPHNTVHPVFVGHYILKG